MMLLKVTQNKQTHLQIKGVLSAGMDAKSDKVRIYKQN